MAMVVVAWAGVCALLLPAWGAAQFLPPVQQEEYMYSMVQDYQADVVDTGKAHVRQRIVATQYWSLKNQAQRGVASSGPGAGSVTAVPR